MVQHTCYTFAFSAIQLQPANRIKNVHVFPKLLDAVADRVSTEYFKLGLELGFSIEKIKQFRMNKRTNTLEIIREMLREWMEKYKTEGRDTIGWLATALLNARGNISSLLDWDDEIRMQGPSLAVDQDEDEGKPSLIIKISVSPSVHNSRFCVYFEAITYTSLKPHHQSAKALKSRLHYHVFLYKNTCHRFWRKV